MDPISNVFLNKVYEKVYKNHRKMLTIQLDFKASSAVSLSSGFLTKRFEISSFASSEISSQTLLLKSKGELVILSIRSWTL